jgi:hypothetical protein
MREQMMKFWILGFLTLTSVMAEEKFVPPEQIKEEVNQAQIDVERAQKMFNPWFTGPIIAGSASMMPPGVGMFQPYFYTIDNYGIFDKDRHTVSQPDLWQVSPQFVFQTGITSWMDIFAAPQLFINNRHSQWYTGFADLPIGLGFKVCDEGVYYPKMKIQLSETFPTGKYQNLNPKKAGADAIGAGSYQTGFSFRMSKILFWWTPHPVAVRAVTTYTVPTTVHVNGYNAYGGGVGTHGKVRPGNNFNADLGIEFSINQRWVLANDFVYQFNDKTKFSGTKGIDPATGLPNVVGLPSSDVLQLAPAIEYNFNENLGILAGVWFTVWGRNTSNFIDYVFSLCWVFP